MSGHPQPVPLNPQPVSDPVRGQRLFGLLVRGRTFITLALIIVLSAVVFAALYKLLSHVPYRSISHAVRFVHPWQICLAVLTTCISYLALAGYDFSSLRYAGARVRWQSVGMISFIAYALGNTIGLGVLTGGAVRMRLYTAAGVEVGQVAQAIAFNALAFGLGMTTFGALGIFWGADAISSFLTISPLLIKLLAGCVLIGVTGLIALCYFRQTITLFGRWTLRLPPPGLALRQLLISAVDLGFAAATLWVFIPAGLISPISFFAYFCLAISIGVISHVPGGLGVFEAIILLAAGRHANPADVAAALVLYRSIYFFLPLLVATVWLAVFEMRGVAAPVGRAAVKLSPWLLAAMTLVAGIMLLVSGVTPATHHAEELLRLHVPLFVVEASHLIGSIAGLAMLFLARGLLHRLDAAWWAALASTLLAAVLAFPKGLAISEFTVLSFLALLLFVSRKQFTRRSSLFSQKLEIGWLMAVACVIAACCWILLFAYRDVDYADRLWWEFAFDGYAPRSMRTLMVVAVLALMVGLAQLFRRSTGNIKRPDEAELMQAASIIQSQPASDACLALMGDKTLLFSSSGKSFIMYAKYRRSWIALSDPVGDQKEWPELIWRFVEMVDAHGGRAAFYKSRPQTLPMYLDAGMRVFKLGEEAYVALDTFSLQGPKRANLRHGFNRAEREGLSFCWIPAAEVRDCLPQMRAVSNAWLKEQNAREKGFSLGNFDENYLCSCPAALIRQGDRLVAFASLMAPEGLRIEVSIDLMRQLPDAPPGTMDYLFASLMLHYKAAGYTRFGLGMAPMSGMADHQLASRWQRFGRMIFRHGGRFYNFRGLRHFKDKFDPVWEARYLVTRGGPGVFLTFTDTAGLIGRGLRGVVGK